MWERVKEGLQGSRKDFDYLLLISFFPVVWSFITATFFLKHPGVPDPYILVNYPFVYYGLIAIVTVSMLFSLLSPRSVFKQVFFLVLIFGGIYSAVNGYQITHKPDITVGLFIYSTLNAVYGFLRTGVQQRKTHYYVQSFNR